MATYDEIYELRSNSSLKNRIAVAVTKKAQAILDSDTPTAGQVEWAEAAISDPIGKAGSLMNYVLAANSSATVNQIITASDSAIQSNINSAVDTLTGA